MKTASFVLLSLLSSLHAAYAWGAIGHQAVGFIAMPFLAPKAFDFVNRTLAGDLYHGSLGPAATWADEIKSNASYRWASNLHFVDALDSPPVSCSVNETRDCANDVCILGAIANYTVRVVDPYLAPDQIEEALKFLDHFIGDIGQPLHVEAAALGGNNFRATCNGDPTWTLHSVWDTGMINTLVKENYSNNVNVWADALVARIKSGDFASVAESWISCSSTTAPATLKRSIRDDISGLLGPRDIVPLACPLVWAAESNVFDCSYVWGFSNFTDLCASDYYTGAVPIIELQIAKQGFRLAAWLNVLFDGYTEL